METDIRELRSGDRFVVSEPLTGSFGSIAVTIRNIGDQGVQIEHTDPLRIATKARLWFKRGDTVVSTQGLVVWSRLSTVSTGGAHPYVSGVRIEGDAAAFAEATHALAIHGVLQRDFHSLDRKKQIAADRANARAGRPSIRYIHPDLVVPPDEAMLIRHARERLNEHPEEAMKWRNRAKYAMTENGSRVAAEMIGHREDVLAVWEYLERSVPIGHIVRVFEKG